MAVVLALGMTAMILGSGRLLHVQAAGGQVSREGAAAPPEGGRALFVTYCASCHGPNGRGDGVMASELRRVVPDLTKFAMRNSGAFPSVRVHQIINGVGIPSHGTREMPVWGDAFRRMRGGSEATAAARIAAVTSYLESIQDRNAE